MGDSNRPNLHPYWGGQRMSLSMPRHNTAASSPERAVGQQIALPGKRHPAPDPELRRHCIGHRTSRLVPVARPGFIDELKVRRDGSNELTKAGAADDLTGPVSGTVTYCA